MDSVQSQLQDETVKKTPVVRGARACTVCRAAKMKCVGSEDGTKPCQRCKRSNTECIFEKHRRGRKPGSKLSEASKMLRRLEKGLSSAKLRSQANDASLSSPYPDSRRSPSTSGPYAGGSNGAPDVEMSTHFPGNELPPLPGQRQYASSSRSGADEDEEDCDPSPDEFYPAKLIRQENSRNSFFKTILNPENEGPSHSSASQSGSPPPPYQHQSRAQAAAPLSPAPTGPDPITTGIMDENQARVLFDLVFLRLNPFINLFDPALHSVNYVRAKCPLLFTTLLMAGAKFFKPEYYRSCQKLANELAFQAFADAWKSVEIVQAFACLTYWKEPEDTRTWTYIGYACRMAVELGLNKCVAQRPHRETEFQLLERRNRERTYLVLFVHDRSLSMQTGRQWMLPEDELVKRSTTWHEEGGSPIRPEDVILAAFVQLRRISAETMETTDVFCLNRGAPNATQTDVNYEVLLRNCNAKLTQWQETWQREMQRASGESFHHAFLNLFRLYVRVFLNSFGIQAYMGGTNRAGPSLQALSACYTSAVENLQIVTKDFAAMGVLRYGQDSITVMSAYCAIFLLKLLRSSNTQMELHSGAANEIYSVISQTADAYQDASQLCPASGSAAYHSRFLRTLVANDIAKARQSQDALESTRRSVPAVKTIINAPERQYVSQGYHPSPPSRHVPTHYPEQHHSQHSSFHQHFPASPHLPSPPTAIMPSDYPSLNQETRAVNIPPTPNHATGSTAVPPPSELDAYYWRNMFKELGFGDGHPMPHNVTAQPAAYGNGNAGTNFSPYAPAAGSLYGRS